MQTGGEPAPADGQRRSHGEREWGPGIIGLIVPSQELMK